MQEDTESYPIFQFKIIHVLDMNESKSRSKYAQIRSLHHNIRQKQSKIVNKGPNYRAVGKNFKFFLYNSKKVIFTIPFENFTTHSAFEPQTSSTNSKSYGP